VKRHSRTRHRGPPSVQSGSDRYFGCELFPSAFTMPIWQGPAPAWLLGAPFLSDTKASRARDAAVESRHAVRDSVRCVALARAPVDELRLRPQIGVPDIVARSIRERPTLRSRISSLAPLGRTGSGAPNFGASKPSCGCAVFSTTPAIPWLAS